MSFIRLRRLKNINFNKLRPSELKRLWRSNKDYFNRLSPNVLIFITYGLLYDMVVNIYKPFSLKFLTRLGGNEVHISLFNSLPGIVAALVLLPGAVFLSRYKNMKRVMCIIFMISRTFLLAVACVPFFPEHLRPVMFIVLMSLMNFPDALSQSSVQASLGSFFARGNVRATAISLRNKFGNIFIPLITILTGGIISVFPRNDKQIITFYQVFFVMSFVIGMFEIKTFTKFKEEITTVPVRANLGVVREVFRDKKFVNYLAATLLFYFTWQAGWALSGIYQIQNLGADEIWLAILTVASGVASFFTAGFWNKRINRYGSEQTLVLAAMFVGINMFVIGLSPNLYIMILASAYTGFASVGVNIALLNSLLNVTPDENRMVYIGVYNTCTSISLGISPLAALVIMNRWGVVVTMMVVGTARLAATLMLYIRSKKLKAKNTPDAEAV